MNTTSHRARKEDFINMGENGNTLRRRAFLGVVGAAGAAAGCGSDAGGTPAGPTDVGAVAGWAERTWKLLCNQNLIVGRDEGGFYALSAICTHQGCTVTMSPGSCAAGGAEVTATGALPTVGCPCHASAFDVRSGARISGEAQRALPAYKVTLTGGRVLVDRGVTVLGTARAAVT